MTDQPEGFETGGVWRQLGDVFDEPRKVVLPGDDAQLASPGLASGEDGEARAGSGSPAPARQPEQVEGEIADLLAAVETLSVSDGHQLYRARLVEQIRREAQALQARIAELETALQNVQILVNIGWGVEEDGGTPDWSEVAQGVYNTAKRALSPNQEQDDYDPREDVEGRFGP